MTKFLNILRIIILIQCIIAAIVANDINNDFAFAGWIVALFMTIDSFEFE